ncbi:MAG: PAS domain-containing sensor histidine kinase [Caulobacteraceae bacterium]
MTESAPQPRPGLRARLARALRGLARRIHADEDPTRRALQRAALAENRLRAAIDALPEGVVFLDPEGRYILWNQRYAEIYHRSADLFAPGRRLADTLAIGVARGDYPDAIGREEVWIAERLAMMDNPGRRHEQYLSDGRWILIEERRTADGGLIGLRIDITELKEQSERLRHALAQAELANKAKIEFLSNMSHEIRTPLNGVLGLAHVLARTSLDAQQTRLVGTIIESAVVLERVLSDVLDLSRIESGRLELRQEVFSLESLVRDTMANFEPQAADKGLTMALDVAPDAQGLVTGDPVRLRQVLDNLIGNAVKFTAEGYVSVEALRVDDELAEFRVVDTGIGFPIEEAERLFERFVQADGSITRQFGGSGLGLAICRDLVEMMGGRIAAWGEPGKGAAFKVTVPLPRAEQRLDDAPMTAA